MYSDLYTAGLHQALLVYQTPATRLPTPANLLSTHADLHPGTHKSLQIPVYMVYQYTIKFRILRIPEIHELQGFSNFFHPNLPTLSKLGVTGRSLL